MNSVCLFILGNNYQFPYKEHVGRMSCWMGERTEGYCPYRVFFLLSFLAVIRVLSLILVWNSSFSLCRSGRLIFLPIFMLFLRAGPRGMLYATFAHYMGGNIFPQN